MAYGQKASASGKKNLNKGFDILVFGKKGGKKR